MKIFFIVFISSFFVSTNSKAQKKITFDFNIGLNNSIGNNILKSERYANITYGYYSRKKYKNPFTNFTGDILYPLSENCLLGVRSGVYVYILEEYISSAKRTTISIPLQLTGRYKLLSCRDNSIGINLTAGFNFFNIYDRIERYNNGKLLNASLYYLIRKKNILKLGIEKQIDNVSMYIDKINP